ncbi:MAG: lamin tail domain-containing protein [candidate division WOR-3 bacterium]
MIWILCTIIISNPIINEVMLDPLGPETGSLSPGDRNEFIEIHNPTNDTIDMAQFKLQDNAETDSIVPFSEILQYYPHVKATTKIPPESYGVILDREYILPGENYMPYVLPPGVSVMTTKDTDLGNGLSTNDTIKLINLQGEIVSSFGLGRGFPLPSKDGISFERKFYWGSDDESNWRYCEAQAGHTCGYQNSVSEPYSLKIVSINAIPKNYEIIFKLTIKNTGIETISHLKIVYDFEGGYPGGVETIINPLSPDSQRTYEIGPCQMPTGYYRVTFKIYTDDLTNLLACDSTRFYVGKSPMVISEIMYSGETEWIEIYNNSNIPFNLKGFCVGDPRIRSNPVKEDITLEPKSYFVFSSKDIPVENKVVLSGFPALNNTGDTVYLIGSFNEIFDMVPYSNKWGGGYNVSLERLSPDMESTSPFSWTSSREGSTPGRKNSVEITIPQRGEIISLSKKVLAPSRGIPVIAGNLEFPEFPVYATVEIYRIDGIKVLTVIDNELLKDGRMYFTIPVPSQEKTLDEGIYLLLVKGKTLEGKLYVKREVIGIMN